MAFTHALSTNNYGPAKFIVSSSAANGTHTTIASALADATSGDTIFIRPGTYTENLTLVAGVNLTGFDCDAQLSAFGATSNVNIVGKMTASFSGTVTISGVYLKTNSDFFLVVSGAAATRLNFVRCYFEASNNTGISQTSTTAKTNIYHSGYDVSTTGIAHFAVSGGDFNIFYSTLTNGGGSSTVNTFSSASVGGFQYTNCNLAITTSGTAIFTALWSEFQGTQTIGSTNTHAYDHCTINSATAVAITVGVGTGCQVTNLLVISSNAAPIAGAGTITYGQITFTGPSVISTTTQTKLVTELGEFVASGQPSFAAHNGGAISNVTGDGTTYTIVFDTEDYDQAGNYNNATGTFTAPIAGKYIFTTSVAMSEIGAAHTSGIIQITTGGGTIEVLRINPTVVAVSGIVTFSGSAIIDLASGQTALVTLTVSGSTKTVDIPASPVSYFGGSLLC